MRPRVVTDHGILWKLRRARAKVKNGIQRKFVDIARSKRYSCYILKNKGERNMYCYNCGKEIAETVKFCPYCGAE